jgi:glutamate synthase (NADPH/NADH) small chain
MSQPETPKKGKLRPRTDMPEQSPEVRRKNFEEVPFGYTEALAIEEATRCLQCKKADCRNGCPVQIAIPEFIALIAKGQFADAARKLKETNALPSICGRVCPQEDQCEKHCILAKKAIPVAIGNLERFAADWERSHGTAQLPAKKPPNGKRVAVVGSGPAGLTVAGELVKWGFDVTVFEALHEAGGVLVYGIPEFRLPKDIVQSEIESLLALGVKLEKNFVVGRTATIDELLEEEGFDAVFIGTGAGLPTFMAIPGENSIGVYSANEYLTRSNLMKAYRPGSSTPLLRGERVVTVGGGNVAMDSARTALRMGAKESIIVYRRGREEMPARSAEIHHAEQEQIQFELLCNPVEILADERGFVRALKCVRMELGEPDSSGRRRPVVVAGSEFEIACDVVIIAIGNKPNPLIQDTTPDIGVSRWGTIIAGDADGRTTKERVYAGGDVVTGAATVILAMGAGKTAARSIISDLLGAEALADPPPRAEVQLSHGDG